MEQLKKSDHCNNSEIDVIVKGFKLIKKDCPDAELEYHKCGTTWYYVIMIHFRNVLPCTLIQTLNNIGLHYAVSGGRNYIALYP